MANRYTIGALALLAIVGAVLWIPWATQNRVVIAPTPVPPPLFGITPIPLKPGATGCQETITFTPQTQIAEIGLTTNGKPGPPLVITASAPGYRATARLNGGYHDDPAARFAITAPGRAVIGKMCFHNAGRTPVSLNGTTEFRTQGRPSMIVGGMPVDADAKLVFYARVQSSYAYRAMQILGHAATFTPAFFSKWVLLALALLALFAIPLAVAAAYTRAAKMDAEGKP